MIKKILYYSLIMIVFALSFIFGKGKINILAMGNFNNSIGTIPIQLDIDNYNNYSLIGLENFSFTRNGVTVTVNDDNTITFNGTSTLGTSQSVSYNIANGYVFDSNKNYTMVGEILSGSITGEYDNRETIFRIAGGDDNYWYRFIVRPDNNIYRNKELRTYKELGIATIQFGDLITFNNFKIKIMLTEYDNRDLPVVEPFEFGYEADLYYSISASGNNTTVNYYFNDNTYTQTTSSFIGGYLIENYYLPFNIDSKGYISLPDINFGVSSISNSSNSNTYSLYLELTPVFTAYYKGEYTTNLYTKLNYMSNDLFFSGITFSGCNGTSCSNSINSGNLSLSNPKILAVTEINNTGNITTTNISTYYNDDIKNTNYFEYNNYLNVGFRIGGLAETYNFMNGRNYTFGISSLSSRIIDNQTTTTPLPDNLLTQDKYNTCSAWYDIPCQLGNAVTYVIYEAPIVSPVLSFVFSFINIFSSLVVFVDLFASFGIVFGCFVIYMFIELLHKYSK